MLSRELLQNKFKVFIFLSFFILVVEFFGGIFTNSLALLSDAGHVLVDLLALSLTYFSLWLSQKNPNGNFTFGFYRAEILAAVANGIILAFITFFIFYEAISRLISQSAAIKGPEMLIFSALGLIANFYVIFKIENQEKNHLNVRSAYLHVLSDTLSSVGVVIASILIITTKIYIFDPIISIVIGIVILWNALKLIKESAYILMETTPKNIDLEQITNDIQNINGVKEVHNLRVWSLSSDIYNLHSHIIVASESMKNANEIISEINLTLKSKHNITHVIIQTECEQCANYNPNTTN